LILRILGEIAGGKKAPLNLVYYAIGTGRLNMQEKKDIVVLLNVLPDDINVGYHGISNEVIAKVNGVDIKSFKDFILRIHEGKTKKQYTVFETEHRSQIILNNSNIDKVSDNILERNNIPRPFSSDVDLWLKEIN